MQVVPEPLVRAGTVAPALLTLFAAPVIPVSASRAVDAGVATNTAQTLLTVLFSVFTPVLAIGMALVFVRNPVGRVLVAAGGLGLALVALNGPLYANALGFAFRIMLFLLAITAVVTTLRAALPPRAGRPRSALRRRFRSVTGPRSPR